MQKKILITGAAGFVGFHLAKALNGRGDTVLGYDNFNPYYSIKLKHDRASLLKKAGVEIVQGDICDLEKLSIFVKEFSPTHIVNLAAQAGVRYSLTNPRAYIASNIEGFINILELCRKYAPIKLLYASSSSVYGLNKKIPFGINDPTDEQASLYGATKKANELFARTYHHLYKIPVTGLRFFTVYGPWGRPDMAYYSFAKAIESGEPIQIYNDGKMRRDFTYIDDIIEGALAALDLESECELFNLGNNKPVELLELISLLEKKFGKEANKRFCPMQQGDVVETFADIDYSREKLHFIPKISIEEGLSHFVDWYKEYHGQITS